MSGLDCIVIGAGMCGLMAANTLQQLGHTVLVLDKSRGVGGRMATRRIGEAVFDHGAQYFTARNGRFYAHVQRWEADGVVAPWLNVLPHTHSLETMPEPEAIDRYRGLRGMTDVPKQMAQELTLHLNARVVRLSRHGSRWRVICESGEGFEAPVVLMTPPIPQNLELLHTSQLSPAPELMARLSAVTYEPCLALMAVLDGPSAVPAPGGLQLSGEPLTWIADNQRKGISPEEVALTIHAGPRFSRERFEDDEAAIVRDMLAAAAPYLGSATVRTSQLHRWRYSLVSRPESELSAVVFEEPLLMMAGDGFGAPRVEGAAMSGLHAASRIEAKLLQAALGR
jgi:predicted NAD/FAD-dependent oxidoreductase